MHFKKRSLGAAIAVAALGIAALSHGGSAGAQDLPGGTWGTALPVSLAAATPAGDTFLYGRIDHLSCASTGNCAAIGTISVSTPASGTTAIPYPFVLDETEGTWGTPATVSGITSSAYAGTIHDAISCAAAGECAATWSSYVIDETGGSWGAAAPVTAGSGSVTPTALSCAAPGDCAAIGGLYVMDSAGGTWGTPQEITGVADLMSSPPTGASLRSVSCTSPGNCVAGGQAQATGADGISHMQPFFAIETDGQWGQAQAVPGMSGLNPAGKANLDSVSCGDPGDCAATGSYRNSAGTLEQAWVVTESGGTWGTAEQLAAPTSAIQASPESLSCSQQGYCVIAGEYVASSGTYPQAFVATYSGGTWTAQDVPSVPIHSTVASVSCGAPGSCSVAGIYYPPGSGHYKVYLSDDVNGTWSTSLDEPQPSAYLPEIDALSCTAAGYCTAVGHGNDPIVFTMSEATASAVTLRASAPTVTYGDEETETLTATVTSPSGGTPAGTVTVADGKLPVCQLTLAGGTGTCAVPATALPAGADQLTAVYSGDASHAAASSVLPLTVAKQATATAVTVSPSTVTFGTSYHSVISVTVAHKFAGTLAGGVQCYLNGNVLGVADVTNGKAACTVPQGQGGGSHTVTAKYLGDGNFSGSASAVRYFTVARAKTATSLTLAKATVTYGHENAEKLTVTITSPATNRATGKVTVTTGSGITVCVITLKYGTKVSSGSCWMGAWKLRPGTWRLYAKYGGSGNYLPSTSGVRYLKVAA